MDIHYRPARDEDMAECADLFLESIQDMRLRHNTPSSDLPPVDGVLNFYRHVRRAGIYHVAEAQGRIAALAYAILRDQNWFLSAFWARPELQRQGIGMPLLRGVWNAGKQAGATVCYVWSSPDLTAMAAYMKIGMLPGCQILTFEGAPQLSDESAAACTVRDLDKSYAMQLDEMTLGTRRELDHDYFISTGCRGRQVFREGKSLGYFYLDQTVIGPAAWQDTGDAAAVLTLACLEGAVRGESITLELPGMNHAALRFALQAGLRLTNHSHLLMSGPFGRLENYVPSGGALF